MLRCLNVVDPPLDADTIHMKLLKAMKHKNANNAFRMWVRLVHGQKEGAFKNHCWKLIVDSVKANVQPLAQDTYGLRIYLEVGIPDTFMVSLQALNIIVKALVNCLIATFENPAPPFEKELINLVVYIFSRNITRTQVRNQKHVRQPTGEENDSVIEGIKKKKNRLKLQCTIARI